jgi:hypothetical protein
MKCNTQAIGVLQFDVWPHEVSHKGHQTNRIDWILEPSHKKTAPSPNANRISRNYLVIIKHEKSLPCPINHSIEMTENTVIARIFFPLADLVKLVQYLLKCSDQWS